MEIVLSGDERAELVRRAELPDRRTAERARIILACADGMSNAGAARAVGAGVKTVRKWRGKFAAQRLAGLEDEGPIGRFTGQTGPCWSAVKTRSRQIPTPYAGTRQGGAASGGHERWPGESSHTQRAPPP